MRFSNINDYIGEINLALSDENVQINFNAIGTQVETDILKDLLNGKLYNDFINDLTNNIPGSQQFTNLLNGTTYIDDCGETIIYEGLKRMLRYFIYENYLEKSYYQNTGIGQMQGQNENSVTLNRSQLRKARAIIQNEAIKLYRKAIIFINDNYTDYFTGNDYNFWIPRQKTFLGKIITKTPVNNYFLNRSSEEN